ncbi:MAG: phosphoglucosamine mutase [Acidobacteria bacterium]|nr:phosphoglucosamine mutase [Acidobacteriota bacterium]
MSTEHPWFGTDGMRGVFGEPPLDRPTVTALGRRLAEHLHARLGRPPQLVLAGDTRDSTPTLCRWIAGGLESGGAACRYAGVLPTPAVAFLTTQLGADGGIAVSASHNPHPDNGIKLIGATGFKWPVEEEQRLEAALRASSDPEAEDAHLSVDPLLPRAYRTHLLHQLPGDSPLDGLRLALDTANGAASALAGEIFESLGAEVEVFHSAPDGLNINRGCGSTDPADLIRRVAKHGEALGVAFDGDADRALLVDDQGQLQDGDAMLYLWARTLAAEGNLTPARIVATTMSNLGLEQALGHLDIGLVRCGVGDRQVVETLQAQGLVLGGEQSGHLVHLGRSSTGDGLLTALHLAFIVAQAGRPLSELLEGFERFPQVLVNTPVARKVPFDGVPRIRDAARQLEATLGDEGRLLLRYSGTEPLARVMIEGPDQQRIESLARELADLIREELG